MVRIIESNQSHGTVSVREGRDYPNFVQSKSAKYMQQAKRSCNFGLLSGPHLGYVGIDSVDLDVIYCEWR